MAHPVPAIVFLAVFVISAAVHLFSCWRGKPKSAYTKPLLVSSLALTYAFAAQKPSWVLILALFLSWLGDVLLMPKVNAWFVAGGVSFLLSHVTFIFVYLPHIVWAEVNPLAAGLAAITFLTVSALVMRSIWAEAPKAMRVPLFLYLAANSTMNVFAFMLLLSVPCAGTALASFGAALFFASDCILFLSRYHKKADRIPKRGFQIMLTYIAGEALITLGVFLLG